MDMLCLVLLSAIGCSGQVRVLDAFDYRQTEAARGAWRAAEGTPPLDAAFEDGVGMTRIRAPFAARPQLSRAVFDRDVRFDLSAPGEFTLEARADRPEAVGGVTLYFRSGAGWYGATAALTQPAWQKLRFRKESFRTEDKPAGWADIQGVRIAFWRGEPKDVQIDLRGLAALTREVAIILPAALATANPQENRTARETAGNIADMLDELGLAADSVEDAALAPSGMAGRRLAILPLNPSLPPNALEALAHFVRQGGKLLVCYTLPEELGRVLGFRSADYLREQRPGEYAEIRFEAADVQGLPKSVRQASWNIYVAQPAGENSRVIGWWFDDRGQPTGRAAMLLSDTGAFFSHIVLSDDREGKKQMLAAVLGRLCPPLWKAMARSTLDRAVVVGHCRNLQQLMSDLKSHAPKDAQRRAAEADMTLQQAEKQFLAGGYPEAVELGQSARQSFVAAYLLAQPSPAVEGRAVWNHSGTGAYAGDWGRSIKLLADAGFNMVLPNMLWGGVAHYASDVLPSSKTFAQYGDQVEQCVAAAKRYGVEVHVWKVNWNLGRAPQSFVDRMRREGRLQVSVRGEPVHWLCPSHPENQRLELNSLLELVVKHQVDGLHFDYIRYPDRDSCYCDGCRLRFEKQRSRSQNGRGQRSEVGTAEGGRVEKWPEDAYSGELRAEYNNWRCDQITRLVAAVRREVKKQRPDVKISAAVFGSYPSCRESVGQDWVAWVKAGYLDFVCPMDYTNDEAQFAELVSGQLKLIGGRIPCYPGIGATASRSRLAPDQVVAQIRQARRLGAAGFTIFNYSSDTAESIVPAVGQGAGAKKAAVPHR